MSKKQDGINAARLLLEYYGHDSLSYFSLHKRKRFFFSSSGKSFLAYTIRWRVAIVSSDPIGPKDDIPLLLEEFKYFTRGAHLTSCFVGIHPETIPFLSLIGHKKIHIGEEAVLDLAVYNKKNLKKKVRRAERHIKNLGITCQIYSRKNMPLKYLKQIQTVSNNWLEFKGGKERGFTMTLGRIPETLDKDCEFILALDKNKLLGFLIFVPAYTSNTFSLDIMRRIKSAPNGLTEFLLLQAFDYYKMEKVKSLSLNFATFHQKTNKRKRVHKLFEFLAYKPLSYLYKTNCLYKFNEKFLPQWQGRYLAFEYWLLIPLYLLAISQVELNLN